MRNFLTVIAFLLFACTSKEDKPAPAYPTTYEAESEWVEYEGFYPDDRGGMTTLQLSLRTGGVGLENQYQFFRTRLRL